MSRQCFRTHEGGAIDRSRRLSFRFDGRTYEGFPGDTLASALVANGVRLVGRSFKYHRPRGVLSAGSEEPNALVTLGSGARIEPNARATVTELYEGLVANSQNAWPSLGFDLAAASNLLSPLIPAGFYYKTFIGGPRHAWTRLYEPAIRRMAGLGKPPREADPDNYDKRHIHCDVLVIGAGATGLAAALSAAADGGRVILVDEQARPGGALKASLETIDGMVAPAWVDAAAQEFVGHERCKLLTRTTAFGRYDHGLVIAVERRSDHDPARTGARQRLWQIRARRTILATGALEQPLLFGNNDRPGVMLAHSAQVYARHFGALAGRRVIVGTTGDSGHEAARAMVEAGAEIVAIVDGRRAGPADPRFPIVHEAAITRAFGRRAVRAVEYVSAAGKRGRLDCDALLMSGGWQPSLHLHSHVGGRVRFDSARNCLVPDNALPDVVSVGGCAGLFDLARCIVDGHRAGAEAVRSLGIVGARAAPFVNSCPPPVTADQTGLPFAVPPTGKCFVDFQNDVTSADIDLATREGFVSVEHLKRYTTTGMATDQGKLSNVNALRLLAERLGVAPSMVGNTTFRPPYTPVTLGAMAGLNVGPRIDPVRYTPVHDWHVTHGAVFENVGQWVRAKYYPRARETMNEAVQRECRAVRGAVGMFDASTLGKIDLCGPDAARFLNLVYSNSWTKLGIGRCRYGLMLSESGMVMDDGVTSRIAPNRYLMTTTTANAARLMEHLEDLLQTEWPDLKVYLTSVTEHWSVCVVTGPRARMLLKNVVTDVDLSNEAFPHLSVREGKIGGRPVRLCRISFTGELSFEVHAPAQYGLEIWETLYAAGGPLGVTAYGTEATHVLRAEKGYIIIGQETDGTATPGDLGMDWAVTLSKEDFIGKRSLALPAMRCEERKQLVGLRSVDGTSVIDEGAQLTEAGARLPPVPMLGHVTSSYWSENCGGPIAMALLKRGRSRKGDVVHARSGNRIVPCRVCDPVFYDPAGVRING